MELVPTLAYTDFYRTNTKEALALLNFSNKSSVKRTSDSRHNLESVPTIAQVKVSDDG